ncbi:MAG: hypothetical protein ACREB5_02595, partial [Sphingomonadaceae bacterium]
MHAVTIGTALLDRTGRTGYVAEIREAPGNTFTLSGGMKPVNAEYICCFDNHVSELPDGIAAPYIDRAKIASIPAISAEETAAKLVGARRAMAASREAAQSEKRRLRDEFVADAASRIPSWAKAVLVAELIENKSDIMSDYFDSTATRAVILAFSRHTRDIFPEMRQAAQNFADTVFLADAPESAEHREKWSMGADYYLKDGSRHECGWRISKVKLRTDNPALSIPTGEWAVPTSTAAVAVEPLPGSVTGAGLRIEEHIHTKKGFPIFICIMPERVERAEFDRLRDLAVSTGGWYSRPWGGTPGGFAFKDRPAAEAFATPGQPSHTVEPGAAAEATAAPVSNASRGGAAIATKLRTIADGMSKDIADKFRDRLTNTPKRQREAASARLDGYQFQRAQAGLRKLADLHEAGTVPKALGHVTSKKIALELARAEIDRSQGGYYDAGRETGRPGDKSEAAQQFWALIAETAAADREAEKNRRKVEELRFTKIPGFFPTPDVIVDHVVAEARLPDGPCLILEPEAGSGAICDGVKRHAPEAMIEAYEVNGRLRDVLQMKGINLVGSDFMLAMPEPRYERVLMNPPFENSQDIEHVRHAFKFLKPGGRLIAIMSPGPFFRQDRRATEFREWLRALGGDHEKLPDGAFKESGTGVGTVLVT